MKHSIDLVHDLDSRPAARQFRVSLEAYLVSHDFKPATALTPADLQALVRTADPPKEVKDESD
jgi:hypothetical protein